MSRYAKTITAVVGAICSWAAEYYAEDPRITLLLGIATAVGVYTVPNNPPRGEPADPKISETGPIAAEPVKNAAKKKAPAKKKAAAKKAN